LENGQPIKEASPRAAERSLERRVRAVRRQGAIFPLEVHPAAIHNITGLFQVFFSQVKSVAVPAEFVPVSPTALEGTVMSGRVMVIGALAVCLLVAGCESPAQRFNKYGLEAYGNGNYRKALGAFEMAVENDPDTGDYYFNRGACYQALGQLERALTDYKMATKLNPGIVAAWEQMADCHIARGEPEMAVEILRKGCRANPYSARPFIAVANFYKGRGDLEQAEVWLAKAVVRDPQNAAAHREYGRLLLRLGKQEKGIEEFRKSLELEPVQPGLSGEVTELAPTGDQLPPPKPVTE